MAGVVFVTAMFTFKTLAYTRLREQIDLAVLCRELVGVVDDTVQPRHPTLWLRPSDQDV